MSKTDAYNSAVDIVLSSLSKYGGKQKVGSTYRLIVCPFHDDSKPSLSVNISKPGLAVGTFNCWACPASGNWNKLADKLGFPKFKKWQEDVTGMLIVNEIDEQALLGEKTEKQYADSLRVDIISDWNNKKIWRGFSGKLMSKLQARFALDRHNDEPVLFFPVKIGGHTVGYVKALVDKTPGVLPYVSSSGPWIKDKGLWPYDHIRKMIKKVGYLVLVEGPRDALRLIMAGIPALCVFGVQNFGVKKATYVMALGDAAIYIMPDNDNAGKVLYTKAKDSFKELGVKLRRIKLPREKDKNGKIIKIDPCSASEKLIKNLKQQLEDKHGD